MRAFFAALALSLLVPAGAGAQHVLRMASVAPEGTAWARELKAFARDVATSTGGTVRVKWYLGGIAGDDLAIGERIRRDQLDGAASGGMLCERVAPSLRVLRVMGICQTRDESSYVVGRLRPIIDAECERNGFISLVTAGLGPEVLFTRSPVRSLAELKQSRLWIWNNDDPFVAQLATIGVHAVPLSLEAAARAYDDGQVDGFLTVPSAALAFQWSTQARYVSDLRVSFLTGCIVVATRAWDDLSIEAQAAIRAAAAKLQVRFEDVGHSQDEALLGGLFARQGLRPVPVSASFRSEFFEAARAAREALGDKLVPRALLTRVLEVLADYRLEHGGDERGRRP
jgi:TRAP-type C4-dicarboxylate transport system substrate-binding protein